LRLGSVVRPVHACGLQPCGFPPPSSAPTPLPHPISPAPATRMPVPPPPPSTPAAFPFKGGPLLPRVSHVSQQQSGNTHASASGRSPTSRTLANVWLIKFETIFGTPFWWCWITLARRIVMGKSTRRSLAKEEDRSSTMSFASSGERLRSCRARGARQEVVRRAGTARQGEFAVVCGVRGRQEQAAGEDG
jgi:hypothetical protein